MTAARQPVLDLITHSPDQTRRLGMVLGRSLRPQDVVLMSGPLGSGKTTFIQGLARGLGVESDVLSPTYTLVMEHQIAADRQAGLRLYHVDLYRLSNEADELYGMGFDEYLDDESAITVIEWPQRAVEALPSTYLIVELERIAPSKRRTRFLPVGERYDGLAREIKNEVTGDR